MDFPDIDWQDFKLEFVEVALLNNDENVTVYSKKCLLPRKCYLSGKKLWMKDATKLVRLVRMKPASMSGTRPIKETYWIDSKEYVLAVLRYKK